MTRLMQQLLFVGITFLAVSMAPSGEKKTYTSAEGKMSLTFPGEYEVGELDAGDATTTKISALVDDVTYFGSYTLHTTEMTNPVSLAQTSMDAFVETLGGEIIQQSVWKIKKNKGLQADIDLKSTGAKVQYHVIIVGQIQYQLAVVASYDKWDKKKFTAFAKTFKILK